MLRIWGRTNSTNVKKVLWCAEELGLPAERLDAGGAFGVVDEPDYRRLNPNGRVPCLEDGDLVLWESNAIVRYLCAEYAVDGWYPATPRERAVADKWMDWSSIEVMPAFRPMFWNLVREPAERRDAEVVTRGVETTGRLLAIADAALSESDYLGGEQPTMGDIPLGCIAYAWFTLPIERPPLPALEAWYQRLAARPAYRKHVMIELT